MKRGFSVGLQLRTVVRHCFPQAQAVAIVTAYSIAIEYERTEFWRIQLPIQQRIVVCSLPSPFIISPTQTVVFTVVTGAAPESAVLAIKPNGVNGAGGSFLECRLVSHSA